MAPARVLCCGDSLTAGLVPGGSNAPYAIQLAEALGVPVDEIGVVGTRADEMLATLEGDRGLLTHLRRAPYTVVAIMVGTNDLAFVHPADRILAEVQQLHGICHQRGLRTIALSIPPSDYVAGNVLPRMQTHWTNFNRALEAWAASMPEKVLFVDTSHAIPFSPTAGDFAPDLLHLTPAGYAKLGRYVGRKAAPFVLGAAAAAPAPTPPAAARPPRAVVQQRNERSLRAGTVVMYRMLTGEAIPAVVVGPAGWDHVVLQYAVNGRPVRDSSVSLALVAPVAAHPATRG